MVPSQCTKTNEVQEKRVMQRSVRWSTVIFGAAVIFGGLGLAVLAQQPQGRPSSYSPVIEDKLDDVIARMTKAKPDIAKKQKDLLEMRYDMADKPAKGVTMSRKKAVQEGVRVKLNPGTTWDSLAATSPDEIKEKGLWPKGFPPLPHPNHAEGGMTFPKFHIDEVKKQEERDLTRFDLDFDLPDHFLPEFPPPMYLTTRPDLGDVTQGKLVTIDNFFELFKDICNPKQLEGLRLLLTPMAQQQFNSTDDRRTVKPHRGVTCFDCHVNGHTNGATHLVGDIRPQEHRHRIDVPTLRG